VRGVFVTGTGTEVGKTVVAAAIARTAAAAGERVAVFKPAVSGLDDGGEPDHLLLRRAAGSAQSEEEIAPYRFGPAVSPHLAAELAAGRIDHGRMLAGARGAAEGADLLVCEGVGGFCVPLTRSHLVRDFARELALPVVIAAGPGLGTINHTLLTLEAVRAAGLEAVVVVLTPWPDEPSALEEDNRATIAALGAVGVEVLPRIDLADPHSWPQVPILRASGGGAPSERRPMLRAS